MIPTLEGLRQEERCEFEVNLDYIVNSAPV